MVRISWYFAGMGELGAMRRIVVLLVVVVRVGGRRRETSQAGFVRMSRKGPKPVIRTFGCLGSVIMELIVWLWKGWMY